MVRTHLIVQIRVGSGGEGGPLYRLIIFALSCHCDALLRKANTHSLVFENSCLGGIIGDECGTIPK